jgi:phosphatidylglycerophosphate synthase
MIICREIFISGLREFLGKTNNVEIPVTELAKWKTASQMLSVTLLILTSGKVETGGFIINIYYIACMIFWLSAGLTLYTGYQYFSSARQQNLI